jgi:hypothetical protein
LLPIALLNRTPSGRSLAGALPPGETDGAYSVHKNTLNATIIASGVPKILLIAKDFKDGRHVCLDESEKYPFGSARK